MIKYIQNNKYLIVIYLFLILPLLGGIYFFPQIANTGLPTKIHAAGPNMYFNGSITATIYNTGLNNSTFSPTGGALFSQTFPDIMFDYVPEEDTCSQPPSLGGHRPMVDSVPNADGTSCSYITVQGNGYQAGSGSLQSFAMVLTGSFYVDGAGKIPLRMNHDDGWYLGIGSANGNQPTYAGGDKRGVPATSWSKKYPIVGGQNVDNSPGNGPPNNVSVNFPAAGIYPFEIDYFEVDSGTLYLLLRADDIPVVQAPAPTSTPTPTPIPTYTISGNIFNDANKNKVKDVGENNYAATPAVTTTKGTITNNTNGSFTISNITAGTVTVSYTSLPGGYYLTSPLNGPPPSFTVTVGPGCTVNGAPGAICNAGNIINLNFGITNTHPWFQATCGDMRNDNGITDLLPVGQLANITNASCTNAALSYTGDTSSNYGDGQASATNQEAGGDAYPEVFSGASPLAISYSPLLFKAQSAGITPTALSSVCTLSNCNLPNGLGNFPHGIYQASGNVTLNGYNFKNNTNYIFLINGNLTITGPLTVPNGSTVLFATTGNIVVSPAVGTTATSTTSNLDGWYIAGKNFIVNSAGICNDLRLNIAGSVVANASGTGGTIQNNRDLCGNDPNYPTISFTQRLDMILNAPQFLAQQLTLSQEIAP